jgi:hypothetical protein
LDNPKTKIVKYRDESGKLNHAVLPIGAPDSEAPLGLPVGLILPPRWEPVREPLEEALAARGIVTTPDLYKPGADDLMRMAIQQVIGLDIQTFKQLNPKEK